MEYIPELQATIERLHRCKAAHTRTEVVKQTVDGRVMWDGRVEVFALWGHNAALRCYAWGGMDEHHHWSVTTVLAIPPVVSASMAVIASVAAKIVQSENSE